MLKLKLVEILVIKNQSNHIFRYPSCSSNVIKHGNYKGMVHDIKVTQTSKFARKGMNNRNRVIRRQRQ